MENKQFPEQEGEGFFPEELSDLPAQMEPLKIEPEAEIPAPQQEAAEEVASELPEVSEIPELPAEEEPYTAPEEKFTEELAAEESVNRDGAAFMDRIPDVEEDYLSESEPSAEEPDPSLEILNDPQFAPILLPVQPADDVDDQEYRDNGKESGEASNGTAGMQGDIFQRTLRKGRPKRKKGEGFLGIPNILVTFVWLALIVCIGVTLGRMLWVCAADVLAFGREDKPVTITIYEADTMEDIVDKLYDNGLIRYKSLFNLYADISDAEEDIQPGIYDLNTRYDYHALVNFMSPRSSREVVEGVLIPEGYTCQQIFSLLEENKICTAVDLAAYAADGELNDYWFLEGVERGAENCLEGYLFPDTYDFYKNSSPREVLTKLLDNFDSRFNEDMRQQIDTLNEKVTDGSYGIREIVIVASLIEKESASAEESPAVAGVIYNRLFNWGYPAYLNIDAAIVYAQGGDSERIDTKLESPYNTYTNIGLTPGPIANPGLSSLKAALNPESHNYYYYVLNPSTGKHQFSTTEGEHNAWIAEFYD